MSDGEEPLTISMHASLRSGRWCVENRFRTAGAEPCPPTLAGVGWTFDPVPVVAVLLVAAAYGRRAWRLRRGGRPVPRLRAAAFAAGLVVLVLAVVSPVDTIGESRLFAAHMAQHVLIGDVAPLLLVLGLSGPLLRPLLAPRAFQRLRLLTHPVPALSLWAFVLGIWHLPALYDAALENRALHSLEHMCFLTGGVLLWTALLRLLPGPRWFGFGGRLAALGLVWLTGGALANVFLWSDRAFYRPYVDAPRTWGLSAVADQRAGGGVMLLEMMLVGAIVFAVLGLEWLADAERRQLGFDARARSPGSR
jgi:putative membrane protein